jgi:hypothetical protein
MWPFQVCLEGNRGRTGEDVRGGHANAPGKAFKSSKAERDFSVAILDYCRVLGTEANPGYMRRFVPSSDRELPTRRFVDMAYSACWWQRSDGINREALGYWFGHLL